MRPQSGASSQPGADEEENRVFLLVVGLGSQVQLDEHILVASQRFYLDITVLGIWCYVRRLASLSCPSQLIICQVLGILLETGGCAVVPQVLSSYNNVFHGYLWVLLSNHILFFEILLFSLLQMILPGNRPTRPVLR